MISKCNLLSNWSQYAVKIISNVSFYKMKVGNIDFWIICCSFSSLENNFSRRIAKTNFLKFQIFSKITSIQCFFHSCLQLKLQHSTWIVGQGYKSDLHSYYYHWVDSYTSLWGYHPPSSQCCHYWHNYKIYVLLKFAILK